MVYVYITDISDLPDPMHSPSVLERLSEERIAKTMKHKTLLGRKQSMGAGLLLDYVLKRHGIENAKITIAENQKPVTQNICFNLSHSKNAVVCAVSEKNIGCDIEALCTPPIRVADRFFCPSELEWLYRFGKEEQNRAFFRLWTAKESYMKYTGAGMSLPLNSFEIRFEGKIGVFLDNTPLPCYFKEYSVKDHMLTICSDDDTFSEDIIYVSANELT